MSHPATYSGEMRISRIQALSTLRILIFVPAIPTQERQGSFGQVSQRFVAICGVKEETVCAWLQRAAGHVEEIEAVL